MDIKKFIASDRIDNDYNRIIQKEIDATKNKSNNDPLNCLYRVDSLDFFKLKITYDDIKSDRSIAEFENMCKIGNKKCLGYTGAMIKRYFDPNFSTNKIPIKNYYTVLLFDTTIRTKDLIKEEYRKNVQIMGNYYVIRTSKSTFYIDKRAYQNMSNAILSCDSLDRVILNDGVMWVSGMFVLDLYKKLSCYDANNVDPIFDYPEDILDIYNKTSTSKNTIKYMLDIIDLDSLQKVDRNRMESSVILVDDQKYTIIEYLMVRMMENNHPIIVFHMRNIFMFLLNFTYFRPIWFVAKMIGFDKKYLAEYELILEIKHDIQIDPKTDIRALETVYHIDMFIMNHIIKNDDDDQFIDYICRMGIVKKFKRDSKTTEKIISWIVEHKAIRIINTLIECSVVDDRNKYKLIFLTQEFNLLGKEFIKKYIAPKESHHNVQRISITKKNNIPIVQSDQNDPTDDPSESVPHPNTDQEVEQDTDPEAGQEVEQEAVQEVDPEAGQEAGQEVEPEAGQDTDPETVQEDGQETDPEVDNDQDANDVTTSTLDEEHKNMMVNMLDQIIDRGLTKSFLLVLKLCPNIIDLNRTESNVQNMDGCILHTIKNDHAVDILEIIIKKNPKLINVQDKLGRTPLILYAELGLKHSVGKMIELGADYEMADLKSDTFLHKLCRNGNLDIVQQVIRKVTDIIDHKNDQMQTPAIVATMSGHEEIFYILKGLSADLNIADVYGNTVYHYICNSKICLGIIIICTKNKFGFSPYDYCKINHRFYYFENNKN
jgi:ankyrin repeat protein